MFTELERLGGEESTFSDYGGNVRTILLISLTEYVSSTSPSPRTTPMTQGRDVGTEDP